MRRFAGVLVSQVWWWPVCLAAWLLVPGLALADGGESGLLAALRYVESARSAIVAPSWEPGSVAISGDNNRLRTTLSASIRVGRPGAVDVPLLAASGVDGVTYQGSSADWRVEGGVVLMHLEPGDGRAGTVTITVTTRFDPASGETAVIPLPPWPSATLTDSPSSADVFGAAEGGRIDGSVRALTVRAESDTTPLIRAARYRLSLRPGAAEVELRVEVLARGSRGAVAIAPHDVALVDVQLDGKPVAPTSSDGIHEVEVSGRGLRVITARLQVATDGDAEDQRVEIGRVAAPITEVEVRVAGKRAVRFEPEAPLQTSFAGGTTVVHGFLPPGETLQVGFSVDGDAVERTVRFSAETHQICTMDEGLVRGKATVELSIVQGKATAVQLALADDVVVANVEGPQVTTWDVLAASGDLPRRLRVGLSDSGDSGRTVTVSFERPLSTTPGTAVDVPLVRPLGAFRESGAVVLLDGEKVGFAAIEGAPGWLRAGLEALPTAIRQQLDGRADQVWRHIGPPQKLPTKVAAARVREVRLEARGTAMVRIDERSMRERHVVVVEIKAGRTDKLILDLPEAVGEPQVVAPSLSKTTAAEGLPAEPGRKLWELRFSTALEGAVQLQVDVEQLIGADVTKVEITGVRVRGAEVETGVLALAAEAGLELTPSAVGETRPVPTTELPEALAKEVGRDLVAGFRSPRGATHVSVGLQRRATVATLAAFARRVWVDSHVLGDGRIASRAVVLVQSAGRPVLHIGLPTGASVLALTVDGKAVKAARDDKGGLAVPLGGGGAVRVELRYEQKVDELGLFGAVELQAPRFDVRQGPLQWRLQLPGDHEVFDIDTDLRAAGDAAWEDVPTVESDDLMPMPMPYQPNERRYGAEVRDADADAVLTVTFAPSLGSLFGALLGLGAAALLVLTWRRRSNRRAGGAGPREA